MADVLARRAKRHPWHRRASSACGRWCVQVGFEASLARAARSGARARRQLALAFITLVLIIRSALPTPDLPRAENPYVVNPIYVPSSQNSSSLSSFQALDTAGSVSGTLVMCQNVPPHCPLRFLSRSTVTYPQSTNSLIAPRMDSRLFPFPSRIFERFLRRTSKSSGKWSKKTSRPMAFQLRRRSLHTAFGMTVKFVFVLCLIMQVLFFRDIMPAPTPSEAVQLSSDAHGAVFEAED